MHKILSPAIFVGLSFCLSGCAGDPMPMPRGYSSYDQVYKSAPGPSARDVGYEYNTAYNDKVMDDVRYIARDLIEKLDDKLSFGIDKVYLVSPANTAFYNSFDHMLRDELTHRGYLLATSPKNSVRVEFVAREDVQVCKDNAAVVSGYERMYLALAIDVIDKVPSDKVDGFYVVPKYDYKPVRHVELDIPACEGE